MPGCPPRCTSGNKQDDCKGRVVHLLARDDQGYSRHTICNGIAPAMPSTTPETPIYPFQHVCGDFFHHMGISYLVLVDRYSHWPIVTPSREGAKGLIHTLRDTFATYGIPDSITSDGGPEFASQITRTFLKDWNVHHRISSAYHPHANCRAEVGVKSMKRLIAGNTGPGGTLTDSFHKAMLTYRNNPDPETKLSPAMCVFGRPTRDLLPGNPTQYVPHRTWRDTLNLREKALSKRSIAGKARWDEHTAGLTPLNTVRIQNQTGRHPTRWDKSGIVVEVLQYHQYGVRTDGSGRLTTRNRRYLRRYTPHPSDDLHPTPYYPLPTPTPQPCTPSEATTGLSRPVAAPDPPTHHPTGRPHHACSRP